MLQLFCVNKLFLKLNKLNKNIDRPCLTNIWIQFCKIFTIYKLLLKLTPGGNIKVYYKNYFI